MLTDFLSALQNEPKELNQHEQMLIGAKLRAPEKHFLAQNQVGALVFASFDTVTSKLLI